jgi:hypothetical protein
MAIGTSVIGASPPYPVFAALSNPFVAFCSALSARTVFDKTKKARAMAMIINNFTLRLLFIVICPIKASGNLRTVKFLGG